MAKNEAAAAAPAKEPKAPKPPKEPKKINGHALTATITMGQNKEGVAYGPKNNPKKVGSASADRFALYKPGMPLQKALDAGITTGDLIFDSDPKRKFIVIND